MRFNVLKPRLLTSTRPDLAEQKDVGTTGRIRTKQKHGERNHDLVQMALCKQEKLGYLGVTMIEPQDTAGNS